jgi:hypothetical protein
VIGQHTLDDRPRIVAQVAIGLAEKGQSGHGFRL